MPSTSKAQLGLMRADLGRKLAGKPTRTSMSTKQLRDFSRPAERTLPERKSQYGRAFA